MLREDFPVEPLLNTVELASSVGVQRIVLLSAMGIEDKNTNIRQVERGVEASGLEFTRLRINVLLHNYSTMSVQSIRQQGIFVEPVGDEQTSFVDADDVAAVAAALTKAQDKHDRLTR